MKTEKIVAIVSLLIGSALSAVAGDFVHGGQFIDLLLPMEGGVAATSADWGTSAGENMQYNGAWEGTLGRWKDNGIEDTERSYWGGNITRGDDGKYHIYVAGWPSATVGHMGWSSKSMVYHVVSDNVWGPYTYQSTLGTGHNPEIYKTGDTYVIYKIEPLGYYKSTTLGDTWEKGEYVFDLRGRALVAGDNREVSLSNCSFAKREDGSFVMIDRGGGIWVSRDGLNDAWHQISNASVYLTGGITNRGSLEDPVIWRDHLQYHMVVNDWRARYAYYYRSPDGLHWTKEDGKAYTGEDPFAKHADGTVEKWHKYERPRVYQDELGRAIRMNFAVIDCVKQSDLAGDDHSSKNINMPLTRQLLLEVQSLSATEAKVLVKAESDFNPKTDIDFSKPLYFGSHDKVNYGEGLTYASHVESGDDVIITFTGSNSGLAAGEWAPKMIGTKTDGSIAFGYARMPDYDYKPAMLSAVVPTFAQDGAVTKIPVTNYGQSAATEGTLVRVYDPSGKTLLAEGTTSALAPYATESVGLTKKKTAAAGYTSVVVRFYSSEKLLNTENIPLTEIVAAQSSLQTIIDEANALLGDSRMTNGRDALEAAVATATATVKGYDVTAIEAQKTALGEALNTFKYANASPTNGLNITIPDADCGDLSKWDITRTEAPTWSVSNRGGSYDGFDGTFIETYKGTGLKVANGIHQTLENLPAGRYRLRVNAIASNNGNGATKVRVYVLGPTIKDTPVAKSISTGNKAAVEYMLEFALTDNGNVEFGIDFTAATNASWVAFDNWSLKYFGTQEGEIEEKDRNTPVLGIDPQKVYRIKHLNPNRNRYLAAEPNANGYLPTTNTESQQGEYALLPVLGKQGYYYIYNTQGYFVIPSTTYWTLSKTAAAEVLVTQNNSNQASLNTTENIYLLGESNQHANPQVKNNVQVVYAYSAHDTDKGNNWTLELVDGASASVNVYDIASETVRASLIVSAEAENVPYIVTGIHSVENGKMQSGENQLYDLSGRKLTKAMSQGIYIKNGKKLVIN